MKTISTIVIAVGMLVSAAMAEQLPQPPCCQQKRPCCQQVAECCTNAVPATTEAGCCLKPEACCEEARPCCLPESVEDSQTAR